MVSVHERLHHELQHTTSWGLLTRFAKDLAEHGVAPDRLLRLFRFGRDRARQVHEVYATTLSVKDDPHGQEFLHEAPSYRDHYERGRALMGGLDFDAGRFVMDALLRCCMAPAALLPIMRNGFDTLRIADLAGDDVLPDQRLERLSAMRLPPMSPDGLTSTSSPAELDVFYDSVARELNGLGLPTLDTAGRREFLGHLLDEIERLAPSLRQRIEIDEVREPVPDDMEEHEREVLLLRDGGALPVEVVPVADLAERAADLVSHHPALGAHVVVLWVRADLLDRQLSWPGALTGKNEFVVAVAAAGPAARVCRFPVAEPGPVLSAFTMPTVCLSTAATLMSAPAEASPAGITRLYALVDRPVLPFLLREGPVAWNVGRISGPRRLHLIVYGASAFPGVVWFQITGDAGRAYLLRWLQSRGEDEAPRRPAEFKGLHDELDAVVKHVLSTWYVVGQHEEKAS
ncbi:hypothetical protein [Dactylosporangium sp. NPDC050588]|uniref:hypothetical protein n=1 Tax=Dactylosporangium sp. NPDC050588 TaxID=3157211 RepID=UPI0033D5E62D